MEAQWPRALLVGSIPHPKTPLHPAGVPVTFSTHTLPPPALRCPQAQQLRKLLGPKLWWQQSPSSTQWEKRGRREAQAAHPLCPRQA